MPNHEHPEQRRPVDFPMPHPGHARARHLTGRPNHNLAAPRGLPVQGIPGFIQHPGQALTTIG
jgi:hypothetical protein